MKFHLLLFAALFLLLLVSCEAKGSRGRRTSFRRYVRQRARRFVDRFRRRRRVGNQRRYAGGYGSSYGMRPNAVRKKGMSSGVKNALFAGGGLIAGMYIGRKLANLGGSNYLRRNRDRLQVCEGNFHMNNASASRYYTCPQDFIGQESYRTECCYEGGLGYCCEPYRRAGRQSVTLGSVFGSLIFLAMIGGCIYCCCCRNKKESGHVIADNDPDSDDDDKQNATNVDYPPQQPPYGGYPPQGAPGAYPPPQGGYPPQAPGMYPPAQAPGPYPAPAAVPYPPAPAAPYPPAAQPPAPGSGWGAGAPPATAPPPSYSSVAPPPN